MNLSVGIVGLPNVGKSTLFNALLKKQQAFVANYPFATIEPNVGVVPVPDSRLEKLAEIVARDSSTSPTASLGMTKTRPPIVPVTVKFVDIAGLVKGAAGGAGLGNKFLSHIREVSIIAHVVRAFEDQNIIKEGSVDPKSDYQTINTELILADLQSLEKIKNKNEKIKITDKNFKNGIEKIYKSLNQGKAARDVQLLKEEREALKSLFLLTAKPEVVVLNVSEDNYTKDETDRILEEWSRRLVYETESKDKCMVVICAKIEAELAELSEEDQKQYLKNLGLEHSGLERLIQKAYETLGLISFLTAPASAEASARQGEKWEVRAWTLRRGETALRASGTIHTDFEKNFIKAEVVSFEDFIRYGGWKGAREVGKARLEGRDYEVQDGDVIDFKIGT